MKLTPNGIHGFQGMCQWIAVLWLFGSLTTVHAGSAVWAIRGAHNTVYLAGSVHLLKPGEATLPAEFDRAYKEAEALVMEIDLDDLDPLVMQSWTREHGTFKVDTTLNKVLGDRRYQHVATEAKRLGVPIEGLEKFEPWTIALTFVQLQYMKLGYDPQQGVEKQLERRAKQDGKNISGLETIQEQLGKLDSLSYEQQARFLDLTVDEMHEAQEQTDDLLAAWRAGNARELNTLLSAEYEKFPELYDALVTERNQRWVPKIEKLLQGNKDYLVVIGALHLVGKNGLIELARRRGLQPLPLDNGRAKSEPTIHPGTE